MRRYDADEEELRHLFESINGVLLTGGEIADISYVRPCLASALLIVGSHHVCRNTPYGRAAKLLFEWAKEANDAGDNFPLYGTCQGFQLLCQLAAGNFNLKRRVQVGTSSLIVGGLGVYDDSPSKGLCGREQTSRVHEQSQGEPDVWSPTVTHVPLSRQ